MLLTSEQLAVVEKAALAAELYEPSSRKLLLVDLPAEFSASLAITDIPLQQLRQDLRALNACSAIPGASQPPMVLWLQAATLRSEPRAESQVFRDMALRAKKAASRTPNSSPRVPLRAYLEGIITRFEYLETEYTGQSIAFSEELSTWMNGHPHSVRIGGSAEGGTIREALANHHAVSLVGDPGAGKTTMLHHLARQEAKNILVSGDGWIPVYVELAHFEPEPTNRDPCAGLLRLIDDARGGVCHQELTSLFLFDGLNEVAEEARERLTYALRMYIERNAGCNFVITTRRYGFNNRLNTPVYVLQEFSRQDIVDYAARCFEGDVGKAFVNGLTPELHAMVRNPLLLRVATNLYRNDTRLPRSRGRLLEQFVSQLLSWEDTKWLSGADEIPRERRHSLPMPLGFYMQSKGVQVVKIERAVELLQEGLPYEASAQMILGWLCQRGLLREEEGGYVRFCHQAIQEYFAARQIRDQLQESLDGRGQSRMVDELACVRRPEWHDAVAIAAGLLPRATSDRLIEILSKRHEMLTAMCLRNSSVSDDLHAKVVQMHESRVRRWMRVSVARLRPLLAAAFAALYFAPILIHFKFFGTSGIWWSFHQTQGGFQVGPVLMGTPFTYDVSSGPVLVLLDWYVDELPSWLRVIWNSVGPFIITCLIAALLWTGVKRWIRTAALTQRIVPSLRALRIIGSQEALGTLGSLVTMAGQDESVPKEYRRMIETYSTGDAAPEHRQRVLLEERLWEEPRSLRQHVILSVRQEGAGSLDEILGVSRIKFASDTRLAEAMRSIVADTALPLRERRDVRRKYHEYYSIWLERVWPTGDDVKLFLARHWPRATFIVLAILTVCLISMGPAGSPTPPDIQRRSANFRGNPEIGLAIGIFLPSAILLWNKLRPRSEYSYFASLRDLMIMFLLFNLLRLSSAITTYLSLQ